MAVPYTFATATSSIPLSQLDSNFSTPITLGNTSIQLGNTVTTLNNMTLANVTVSSVASTFPNNYLANSTATLGNATITLGGTTTTVGNLTLTNATISSGTYSVTNATVSGDLTLSGGTANGVAYLNGSKVLTTGSALTFDGTDLRIGSPTGGFYQGSGLAITRSGFATVRLNDSSASTSAELKYSDAGLVLETVNNRPILFNYGATEQMRLTSTGLGIGTSSPSAKLQVTTGATGVQALFSHSSGTPTIAVGNSTTTYNTQIGYNVTSEYGYIQAVAAAGVYDDIAINPLGGNLGIGTSSPAKKLDVAGTYRAQIDPSNSSLFGSTLTLAGDNGTNQSGARVAASFESGFGLSFQISTAGQAGLSSDPSLLTYTTRMRLDSSGNLGLGVTPINAYTGFGYKNYEVAKSAFYGFNVSSSRTVMGLKSNVYFDSSGSAKFVGNGYANQYETDQGTNAWYVSSVSNSSGAGASCTLTQAMTLDASGRLGVGVTSPGVVLQTALSSASGTLGNASTYLGLGGSEDVGGALHLIGFGYFGSSQNYYPSYIGAVNTSGAGYTKNALVFYTRDVTTDTAPTERARIDSSGNFLIGTAAIATNATDGFLYIPTCAGTPTGTPTAKTGLAPMVIDSTNNKMYIYSGGAWRALN